MARALPAVVPRDGAAAVDPLDHQGLVWAIALENCGRGLDAEDLAGYGQFGLLRAIELFDPALGYKFSTYAGHWIRHHIWQAISDNAPTIRVPRYLREKVRIGVRPDSPGLSPKQRQNLIAAKHALDHGPVRPSDLDAGAETFDDLVPDHRPGPLSELDDLPRLLAELPERERTILRLRFGLDGDEMTLSQVGERLGLTRERVRQIEAEALARLRLRFGDPEAPTPEEQVARAARRRGAAAGITYHLPHDEVPRRPPRRPACRRPQGHVDRHGEKTGEEPVDMANANGEREPNPEEIDRVERVKAELRAAAERKAARGGPVLRERYAAPDPPAPPSTDADGARAAIHDYRRTAVAATAKTGHRQGRPPTHDPAVIAGLARDNPRVPHERIAELYQAKTGVAVSAKTVSRLLLREGMATRRGGRMPEAGATTRPASKVAAGPREEQASEPVTAKVPGHPLARRGPLPPPEAPAPAQVTLPAPPPTAVAAPRARTAADRGDAPAPARSQVFRKLEAMRAIAEALDPLGPDEADHVLAWIGWHYGGGRTER